MTRRRVVVRAFVATFVLGLVVVFLDAMAAEQRRTREAFAIAHGYARGGRRPS